MIRVLGTLGRSGARRLAGFLARSGGPPQQNASPEAADEAGLDGGAGREELIKQTEQQRQKVQLALRDLAWIHRNVLAPCHVFTGQRPFADRRMPHQEDARLQRREHALKQAGRTASHHHIGD